MNKSLFHYNDEVFTARLNLSTFFFLSLEWVLYEEILTSFMQIDL